jgi:hypothetical protein
VTKAKAAMMSSPWRNETPRGPTINAMLTMSYEIFTKPCSIARPLTDPQRPIVPSRSTFMRYARRSLHCSINSARSGQILCSDQIDFDGLEADTERRWRHDRKQAHVGPRE